MTILGKQGIARVLGRDVDAQTVLAILDLAATEDELTEALSRFTRDEAIGRDVMTPPGSRLDRLCEILAAANIEREADDRGRTR